MPCQLVIDKKIPSLPSRKTDKALIVRAKDDGDKKAATFKLNVNFGDPILIKRSALSPISHESPFTALSGKMALKSSTNTFVRDVHFPSATKRHPLLSSLEILYT